MACESSTSGPGGGEGTFLSEIDDEFSALAAPTIDVLLNNGATATNSTSVTVNINVTSGTPTQMYVTNGGSCTTGGVWEPYAPTKAWTVATGDGTKRVRVRVRNSANENSTCMNDTIVLDTVAPTTPTIAIDAGATTTSSTDVTLTLSAAGTPTEMYVSNVAGCGSGGYWEAYSTSRAWTLPLTDAVNTVYVKYRDAALNESTCASDTIEHRSTAPSANSIAIAGGLDFINTRNVTLTLDASYVTEMYVTNTAGCGGGGVWEAYNTSKAWTMTTGAGVKTVYVRFRNAALENTMCISDTITLDTTAPTTPTISIDSGAAYTSSLAVNLTLSAAGTPAEMYITNTAACASGGVWETYSTSKAWNILNSNAVNTVYVKYRDAALNESTCVSDSITHDTTAPMANSITINSGAALTSGTAVTLALDATGATEMYVTNTAGCGAGGAWQAYSTSRAWTVATGDGTKTVYVRFRNAALINSTCISDTITLDTTAPGTPTISIEGGLATTGSLDVNLTLSATGTPTEMYVTNVAGCGSGGVWEAYSTSRAWTLSTSNATNTVYVKYRDAALNQSTCASDTIVHDGTAPIANSISINSDAAFTNSFTANLTLDATSATEMYVTNTAGCGAGGVWEAYNTSKVWTLATGQGTKTVYVRFRNAALVNSACINDTINLDSVAPGAPSISINSGDSVANSLNVNLTLSATGTPSEMYVTNTAGCGAGGAWEAYNTSKSWTLASPDAANTVYVKYRDAALNESSCASDGINHDGAAPVFAVTTPTEGSFITPSNMASYSLSGTCSENGLAISISGDTAAFPVCTAGAWSTTVNLSGLADGARSIVFNYSDAAGNAATTITRNLTKDTVAPTLTGTSGNFINISNVNSYNVSGACSENGRNVVISGAASDTATCTAGAWSRSLNLSAVPEGAVTLNFDHSDAAGLVATTVTRNVTKDTVAPSSPTISINSGAAYATSTSVTLALSATGATQMYVTNTAGCGSGGTWEAYATSKAWTLSTPNTSNNVYVMYRDAALNVSACISDSIIHDNIAPTLAVTNPVDGSYINAANQASFVLSGTCSDDGRDVNITGAVSTAATCTTGAWSANLDLSGLSEGAQALIFNYSDAAGLAATQVTRNLIKDTVVPSANSISINSGAVYSTTLTVSLGLSSTGADEMYITQTAGCNTGGVWEAYSATKPWILLNAETLNTVYVKYRDNAGNTTACMSDSITHDPNPTLTISGPSSNYVNIANQTNITIGGSCSPSGQTVTIGGALSSTASCVAGTWSKSFDMSGFADGPINITADYVNQAGTPATQATRSLTKDTVAPTPSFSILGTLVGGVLVTNTTSVNLAYYSDDPSEVYITNNLACVGGGAWTSHSVDYVRDVPWTLSGTNQLVWAYAMFRDDAGNTSPCLSASILHDNIAPTFTVTTPSNGAYINNVNKGRFLFSGTCSENNKRVYIREGGVDKASVLCTANAWSAFASFGTTVDGPVAIELHYTDHHGNWATPINRNLVKDTVRPLITITSPINGSFVNNSNASNLLMSGTCAEEGRTVNVTGAGTGSGTCSSGAWSASVNFAGAPQGTVTVTANLTDQAGNASNNAIWSFKVDTINPTITLGSPADGSTFGGTNATFFYLNGTCTELSRPITISGDATAATTCAFATSTWVARLNFSSMPDGPVNINISHSDSAGNVHTISRSFIKDMQGPTGLSISINSGAIGTNTTAVSLGLAATDATEMYITNTLGCGSGGAWESFSSTKAWTLTKTNSASPVYVKYKDIYGNETGCISDDIIHDLGVPAWVSVPTHDLIFPSTSNSPAVTYIENAVDTISGIQKYQYAIGTGLSGGQVNDAKDWTDVSGGSFTATGMSLVDGTKYYVNMRVLDNAGNTRQVSSVGWTVDVTPPNLNVTSIAQNENVTEMDQRISGNCENGSSVGISYGSNLSGPASVSCVSGKYTFFVEISGAAGGRTLTLSQNDIFNNTAQFVLNFNYFIPFEIKGQINTIAKATDGSYFYGGNFSGYSQMRLGGVARISTAGVRDAGFDIKSGFNGNVNAAVELPDGSLVFGGDFTTYRGRVANRIAKIDSSGNLDLTFNPQTGANGASSVVTTLKIYGSSIFVGGYFTTMKGANAARIAKIDFNGNVDLTFNPSNTTSANNVIHSIAIVGSDLYIGGDFTQYRGATANRIARVDADTGVMNGSFSTAGTDRAIYSVLYSGGALYIGGFFSTYSGTVVNGLAKIDPGSGALDTGFNSGSGSGFTSTGAIVYQLASYGTDLIAVGKFTHYRTAPANYIAKINSSGVLDTGFSPATGLNGFNDVVASVLVLGSDIYVGGQFIRYKGAPARRIAKLNGSGDLDTSFNPATGATSTGADGEVHGMTLASGGDIYIYGAFTAYRAPYVANNILKTDASGNIDVTFNPQSGANGFNDEVHSIVVSNDAVYVGGNFTTYKDVPTNRMVKLNFSGAIDSTFNLGFTSAGANNAVRALVLNGSDLYIGGLFSMYNGSVVNRIAKVDSGTGAVDTAFSPQSSANGFNNFVAAMAISGTDLYVGGGFTAYRGAVANRIAKIDLISGDLDTVFSPASDPNGANFNIQALAVSGSDVYIGGAFTGYRGVAVNRIAKISSTGVLDTGFAPLGYDGQVNAMTVAGGALYFAGNGLNHQGSLVNRIAKVNLTSGAADTTFSPATGSNGLSGVVPATGLRSVAGTAIHHDGTNLVVGGAFTEYRGRRLNFKVKLNANGQVVQ